MDYDQTRENTQAAIAEKMAYAQHTAGMCGTSANKPPSILEELKERQNRYIESLRTTNEMIKFLESDPRNIEMAEMLRRAF